MKKSLELKGQKHEMVYTILFNAEYQATTMQIFDLIPKKFRLNQLTYLRRVRMTHFFFKVGKIKLLRTRHVILTENSLKYYIQYIE
jgi:hypothetical protein